MRAGIYNCAECPSQIGSETPIALRHHADGSHTSVPIYSCPICRMSIESFEVIGVFHCPDGSHIITHPTSKETS